jgi:ATP-dependent DNA helicase RecQ
LNTTEIHDPITRAVQDLFGLPYLFPYQRLVTANILEAAAAAGVRVNWPGEPVETDSGPEDRADTDRAARGRQIVILPTGAGKSLCFQLPAMLLGGPTLVIYPILSLMADQERSLRERGFTPVILRGGQSREERELIWNKVETGESRFIIANPEVLLTPRVLERLGKLRIVHVVVDEAHCVSEWGERFRPGYLRIGEIIRAATRENVAETALPLVTAFTATASSPVLDTIQRYIFGDRAAYRIIGNPDRSNISYAAQGCIRRDLAVRDLLVSHPRPAIVFCSSRIGTEQLARYLRNELGEQGLPWAGDIRFYHAGLRQEEKARVEGWFFKNSRAVLIATCAYGMGVDKADIRTVIHRDCPPSVEAYLQESGRAGRDGLPSRAILLWGPGDTGTLARAKTAADRKRLEALFRYGSNTTACRREALLRLLNYDGTGEVPPADCCDVCRGVAKQGLREEESVLAFFRRNRRSYTLNEAASVLAGNTNVRWSEEDAKGVILSLLRTGALQQIQHFPWKNKLRVPKNRKPRS